MEELATELAAPVLDKFPVAKLESSAPRAAKPSSVMPSALTFTEPRLRDDLEIMRESSLGETPSYLLRDPLSGRVFKLKAEDHFICTRLDGQTSQATITAQFAQQFSRSLADKQFKAFLRQLGALGLLAGHAVPSQTQHHVGQRPTVDTLKFFERLTFFFGWTQNPLARGLFVLIFMLAGGIFISHWKEIFHQVNNLFDTIAGIGLRSGPSWQTVLKVSLILLVVPMLRELHKGVVCHYHGIAVNKVRYAWYLYFIPYIAVDLSVLSKPQHKAVRLRIVSSGIKFELALWSLSLLLWQLSPVSSPAKEFFLSVAVAAAMSFLLNANPLGKSDGSLLLSTWLELQNLHARATRVSRAWLSWQGLPEPLARDKLRFLRTYGLAADLYELTINLVIFGLLGYLLTHWLQATGALLFVLLLILRFGKFFRSVVMAMAIPKRGHLTGWAIRLGVLAALIMVGMIPYQKEISGDFRIRPLHQREVRAEVTSQIESIAVHEGEQVTKGQPLIHLATHYIQKEYDLAVAAMMREENRLKDLRAGPKREQIATAQQEVTLAQTTYDHSLESFNRTKKLKELGHTRGTEFDDAKEKMDIDRENLELIKRRLTLIKVGASPEEILVQEAELFRQRENVRHLAEDLKLTTISSPIDGHISSLYFDDKLGQLVNVGDVVAQVSDTSKVYMRVSIPEEHINDVKIGAKVYAKAWAFPDELLEGVVVNIASVVVDKTEDVRMRATAEQEEGMTRNLNAPQEYVVPILVEIANTDGRLRVDMSGYARIPVEKEPFALVFLDPIIRFFRVQLWAWMP